VPGSIPALAPGGATGCERGRPSPGPFELATTGGIPAGNTGAGGVNAGGVGGTGAAGARDVEY
jgi:hypothetical protein